MSRKAQETGQWARLQENEGLVIKIAKQYVRESGSINWRKAWEDHPEWEKTLIGSDGKAQYVHIYANQLKKDGKIEGQTVTARAPRTPAVRASRKPATRKTVAADTMTVEGIGVVNNRNAKFSINIEYLS